MADKITCPLIGQSHLSVSFVSIIHCTICKALYSNSALAMYRGQSNFS